MVDAVGPGDRTEFDEVVRSAAHMLAGAPDFQSRLAAKAEQLAADEARKLLAEHRRTQLEHMLMNVYGFDPSYHVARHRFVHRTPHAWTPLYLAAHRRLGWRVPADEAPHTGA